MQLKNILQALLKIVYFLTFCSLSNPRISIGTSNSLPAHHRQSVSFSTTDPSTSSTSLYFANDPVRLVFNPNSRISISGTSNSPSTSHGFQRIALKASIFWSHHYSIQKGETEEYTSTAIEIFSNILFFIPNPRISSAQATVSQRITVKAFRFYTPAHD